MSSSLDATSIGDLAGASRPLGRHFLVSALSFLICGRNGRGAAAVSRSAWAMPDDDLGALLQDRRRR